jgi:hypothetical protein
MTQVLSVEFTVESKPGTVIANEFRAVFEDREAHLPSSAGAKRMFVDSGAVMMVIGVRVDAAPEFPASDD